MKLDARKYLESRSVKPITLLWAILGVNFILGFLVLIFPKEGISLAKNASLKFVSIDELLFSKPQEKSEDIKQILSGVNISKSELDSTISDSIRAVDVIQSRIISEAKASVNYDTLKHRLVAPEYRRIQLPPNNPNALKALINGLKTESKTKVVRILHYGDSQLEGDRITDYLRNRLQQLFGGSGPGIVLPLEPAASSRVSVFVSQSKNFKKKAIYIKGQTAPNNHYGIGAATFLMSGAHSSFLRWDEKIIPIDTLGNIKKEKVPVFSSETQTPSYIYIKKGSMAYPLARKYSSVKLLYQSESPMLVKMQRDLVSEDFFVEEAPLFGIKSWDFSAERKLRLEFVKGELPKIFGVALDGKTGVAVDNFPMRGSSAVGFDNISPEIYKKQLSELNVRCIILQYGVNVVPNVLSDYTYYRKLFSKQLHSIKLAYPNVSILVIGPSDMSKNQNGNMVSYSNIPLINNAMREASFENGCAFWDLYEAMGGKNSMVEWQKNGLARKDFTHFTSDGAKYVGEMLYESILEMLQD